MRSDASLDPSPAIAGANLNLNQGTIGYTHYFGVFHRLAWVEAAVPLAGLDGSIAGTNVHGSIAGAVRQFPFNAEDALTLLSSESGTKPAAKKKP